MISLLGDLLALGAGLVALVELAAAVGLPSLRWRDVRGPGRASRR